MYSLYNKNFPLDIHFKGINTSSFYILKKRKKLHMMQKTYKVSKDISKDMYNNMSKDRVYK